MPEVNLVQELGLNDTPGVTEEAVKESYLKCQRAVRLLNDRDFITWRKDALEGVERQIRKLVSSSTNEDRKRGMILGIERLFSELEVQAKALEGLAAKLETYEQRNSERADQRSWIR